MKPLFTSILLNWFFVSFAQLGGDILSPAPSAYDTISVSSADDEVYKVVEQMPVFPGGLAGLTQYFLDVPYPKSVLDEQIHATVYLEFVIDKSGNITQPRVARSSGNQILDDAALAYLRYMPKWQPGRQRGKAVLVQMVVPVRFNLN